MKIFKNSTTTKVVSGFLGLVLAAVVAAPAVASAMDTMMTSSYVFTKTLKVGTTDQEVWNLQTVLNMNSDTVIATSGAGSKGMETKYFGAKTKAAVVKFQEKYASEILTPNGLSVGTGLVGAATRAKLNAMGGMMSSHFTPGCSSASGFSMTTGQPCVSLSANTGNGMSMVPGCTSTMGYSPTTGQSCSAMVLTTGTSSGPVSAMLSPTTPAAGYIINNQATAGLLDVTFTGNGTVNSITLTRSGISDQNTLTNVYLYDGVNRLTDGYSFNNQSQLTMNNLGLVVNGSRTISIKADSSGTASANSSIAVALTSFSVGTSVNTTRIQGNTMTLATGSSLAGAVLSANTVGSPTVNAGITAYTFWAAPIQINTRAVSLKAANFRMVGSAPSDALSNIKLYVDGVDTGKLAVVTPLNGSNYAVFDLMSAPISLSPGSHVLEVRANVEKGSNRTVQFSIQNAADLTITDPQVGVNLAVSGVLANNAGTVSIATGSATVVLDTAFQALTNITGGASNVAIGKFKVHAYGEDVKVQSITVTPLLGVTSTMVPAEAGLDQVTLYFNGSQVGTQQDAAASNTALLFQLGSQMIIPAGQDSIFEVRANIQTAASVNYTAGSVSARVEVVASNAQGQSSLATLSVPSSTVAGNTLTVQTGLLAVSKNAGYSSQNVNPNTSSVKIGSFVLQNQSTSEGVRITTLNVGLAVTGAQTITNFSALRTSELSGSASTPVQPQASNTFSADFTLAPGATKTIDILADISTITTGTVQTTLTVSSIGQVSNVSAAGSPVAGQLITPTTGTVGTPTFVTSSATVGQLIAAANGGLADGSKAVFNFASAGAASVISELKFTVTGGLGVDTATTIKVAGISAPVVGGVAYITGLSLAVPFGGSGLNQDVFVSYPEVGVSGIASVSTSTVSLTYVKYTSGGSTSVLTPSVTAPTMTLVGSKPVFGVIDSSDTLSNSLVKIASITITADSKGDIRLGKLPISVTSTGVATVPTGANNIIVKDTNNTVIVTTNTGLAVAAGGTGIDTIIFGATSATSYLIPAGASKTFVIYTTPGTVSGAVNTTSLSTKLGAAASVEWYDVAGNNTVLINASSVFNYPTDTSIISN